MLSPLARPYRQVEVLVPPPNSQGFVLEEILTAVERGSLEPDHLGTDAAVLARLFLLASADRDRLNADPRMSEVPVDELLGDRHIAELLTGARSAPAPRLSGQHRASGDTVGIVAAEEGGLWVSINQSLYDSFGSGILEPSTGVIFHNRGSAFSLDAASPNRLEAGRRPAHTLMPVMVLDNGEARIASATMGRSAHAQIHAELLMAVIDQHRDAFGAVDRPRWLAGGLRADSGVVVESRIEDSVLDAFNAAGLDIHPVGAWDEQVGHAQMITRTADGTLRVGSDPRADGAAGAS
jgi:gamma-glutamyltranspeptidase/glutathione hydrolase